MIYCVCMERNKVWPGNPASKVENFLSHWSSWTCKLSSKNANYKTKAAYYVTIEVHRKCSLWWIQFEVCMSSE